MAFWLNKVGGLMMGIKLFGDTELSREEYHELFDYAPEHRAQVLPILRRKAEFVQLQDDYAQATAAEIDARGLAEAAAEALKLAEEAAAVDNAETPKNALEATRTVAAETAEKAAKATEAVEALEPKVAEMEAILASLPPTVREVSTQSVLTNLLPTQQVV